MVVEWTSHHSSNSEGIEGNLLDFVNLKGIMRDMPISDATSSIRSCAVLHGLPPCDDGVGEASLCSPLPASVVLLCLLIL